MPVLIGIGCVLVITAAPHLATDSRPGAHGSARTAGSVHGPIVLWLAVGLVGVYGGYFGAAQGVLLIAILGIGLAEPLLKINAIKNVLATIANAIASVVFIIVSRGELAGSDRDRRRIGARRPGWWQGRPQAASDDLPGDHRGCRRRGDHQPGELSANGQDLGVRQACRGSARPWRSCCRGYRCR